MTRNDRMDPNERASQVRELVAEDQLLRRLSVEVLRADATDGALELDYRLGGRTASFAFAPEEWTDQPLSSVAARAVREIAADAAQRMGASTPRSRFTEVQPLRSRTTANARR
jgi:hypothetical protein